MKEDPVSEIEHLGPEDGIGWLTPADELSEIELGSRVDLWFTNSELGALYSTVEDRGMSASLQMVGAVAAATSHRGLPFPLEWWPPNVALSKEISYG
jgi:hypothetical protein